MLKLKKLRTGFISRHMSMAKIFSQLAKDVYFSDQKEMTEKIGKALTGKVEGIAGELGELKGSFLKAGQMLSLYAEDILPPEIENLFKSLQSQSSYLSWEQISQQIPKDTLEALTIDPTAFAAASIGQVHKATDSDGTQMALKIQYKNIERVIDMDLRVLKWLVKTLNIFPKTLDLGEIFAEIKQMLLQEIDYDKEVELTQKYKQLSGNDYIVPKVFLPYCSEKVIATEFIHADSVELAIEFLSQEERNQLAKDFFRLFFKEIVEWNLIQSDSHLGNYLIKDNKWVLLDFGATKELDPTVCKEYHHLLKAVIKREKTVIWDTLKRADIIDWSHTDEALLWDYFLLVSEPFSHSSYNWGESTIAKEAMNMGRELHKKVKFKYIPHQNFYIDRKVGGLFYMFKILKANGDIVPWEYLK